METAALPVELHPQQYTCTPGCWFQDKNYSAWIRRLVRDGSPAPRPCAICVNANGVGPPGMTVRMACCPSGVPHGFFLRPARKLILAERAAILIGQAVARRPG